MNIKIAIITGVILACVSVPRAQNVSQNGPYLNEAALPEAPAIYETAASTNDAILLVPRDQSVSTWTERLSNADGIEHVPMSNAYPVLYLSGEEAMVFNDLEDGEFVMPQTVDGETPFPDTITERALRYWLEQSISLTNETAGTGNSNLVQVIFIEPPIDSDIGIYDDILIDEYDYQLIHASPEWYEWLDPRMFISKWAELWMTETNATPVVLVLIKF
jgi:hypothetical protein